MHENKTIGEATYLRKENGDYIPFRIQIVGSYINNIQNMIDKLF